MRQLRLKAFYHSRVVVELQCPKDGDFLNIKMVAANGDVRWKSFEVSTLEVIRDWCDKAIKERGLE